MTTINIVLGFVSIAGAFMLGAIILAFVAALWINQPQINKQQLVGSAYEETLSPRTYKLSDDATEDGAGAASRDGEEGS